jgi:sugar transferase (PEP-CTERM/EpsH1 system associated)
VQHLLFLAHRIPYPPTKGDKVRSYHLLNYLASRYRVHLGAFVDDKADLAHVNAVGKLCEECHLVALNPVLAKVKSLLGLVSGEPLTLRFYRSASMRQWVNRVLREAPIQRVLVFSSAMAQYVISASDLRRVADLVDVDSDKWRQYAATQLWPNSAIYRRESRALLRYEREIARAFDATVFVSAAEADLFRTLAPEAVRKVSHANNGVDSDYFSPERTYANPYAAEERVMVFTGAMDYRPNVDAVVWFARAMFPHIFRALPEARFYIVGARPVPEAINLSGLPGVRVTGTVPDVRPYLAHAKLAVAPLRIARGVQNKVLEAMAMAKPVLASPQAVAGIETRPGIGLVIATGEAEFIRHGLRLLQERDNAVAMGAAGRAHVLTSYIWDEGLSHFDQLLMHGSELVADRRLAEKVLQTATSSRRAS